MRHPPGVSVLALAAAACLLVAVQGLDVPVKFCVRGCKGEAIGGQIVQVSGCTDKPLFCTTAKSGKEKGCCSIAPPEDLPDVIKYCHKSAQNHCQWSVIGDKKFPVYVPNYTTFYNSAGKPTTPWDMTLAVAPGCKCTGPDKAKCPEFVKTAPLITFKPSTCDKCPSKP